MNQEKQPSYYAIIPATIRYNNDLKFPERLLYGEITALITKEGYCFATNQYFSKLYDVIPGTVSRWISHLERLGYIKVELIRNNKKEIIERRIYITDSSCRRIMKDTYEQSHTYPYEQKSLYSISRSAKDNNINIRIDRLFNYIIKGEGEILEEFSNKEELDGFYKVIDRLEFNYTKDILNIFEQKNIEKLKVIIFCIKELFRNNRNVIQKVTRDEFVEIYDKCKEFEELYKNTDKEISDFFNYYYASIIRKAKS